MAGAKTALEHELWSLLKELQLQQDSFLVALSGGVDSLAVLAALTQVLGTSQVSAAYFHHGAGSNKLYRDQAALFCEAHCEKNQNPFFSLKSAGASLSEEEFRNERYQALRACAKQQGISYLVLGHHQDDLLETRVLRLIRGTGLQGLESMKILEGPLFRPFLRVSKKSLQSYLQEKGLQAFEDPSNTELDPLRNWVRHEWLPALESRQKGATGSLARSLEAIASEYVASLGQSLLGEALLEGGSLSRSFYLSRLPNQQRTLLAQYLLRQGVRDFSQAQLQEIQKRLDNSQKVLTFKVAGCIWEVNAQQIRVQSES